MIIQRLRGSELINIRELIEIVGFGRFKIERLMRESKFPLPVEGGGIKGSNRYWRRQDVKAWIASLGVNDE